MGNHIVGLMTGHTEYYIFTIRLGLGRVPGSRPDSSSVYEM